MTDPSHRSFLSCDGLFLSLDAGLFVVLSLAQFGEYARLFAQFFEAANGWYNLNTYNPFELRRSVGVGMRFFLPMFGLLGFDYGVGIDRLGPNVKLKDASRFTFMLGYEPE